MIEGDHIVDVDTEVKRNSQKFDRIFNLSGQFVDGDQIAKESGLFFAARVLEIRSEDFGDSKVAYENAIKKYQAALPDQESFSNGLNREQLIHVMSAFEVVTMFNGGMPDEHTDTRNQEIYKERPDQHERTARIEDFKEKKAMTCVELTVLGQMLLSPQENIYYVSGSADIAGSGDFEGHTFQIIKAKGGSEHPYAILDLSNPAISMSPNGQPVLALFCAPITEEEFKSFVNEKPVQVEFKGQKRTYHFGMGPDSPFMHRWQD